MAKREGYRWLPLVGVVLGLLLVGGCQGGAAGDAGAMAEPEVSVSPADAEATGDGTIMKVMVEAPFPPPGADSAEATAVPPIVREEVAVEKAPAAEEAKDEADAIEAAGRPVRLALAFEAGQSSTYRVTMDVERSVKWEGDTSSKPASFASARTGNHIEVTFDQRVLETNDQGHGLVEVTIKAVRYLGRVRDRVAVDFDSSSADSQSSPLARLIGQSYRLQVTPKGEVLALFGVGAARAAVEGNTPEHRTAKRLVSDTVIKRRHEIPALKALEAEQVRAEESWRRTRTIAFGRMGAKAYECVYRLAGVEEQNGHRVAAVEMKAIPTAVAAEELHQSQPVNPFAPMFDSTGSYEGRLTLDLGTGTIGEYVEEMHMQWVAADSSVTGEAEAGPAVVKMLASELHKLERLE